MRCAGPKPAFPCEGVLARGHLGLAQGNRASINVAPCHMIVELTPGPQPAFPCEGAPEILTDPEGRWGGEYGMINGLHFKVTAIVLAVSGWWGEKTSCDHHTSWGTRTSKGNTCFENSEGVPDTQEPPLATALGVVKFWDSSKRRSLGGGHT